MNGLALQLSKVASKGEHLLQVCDGRSAEAQKLSFQLELTREQRTAFLRDCSYREAKLNVALFEAPDELKRREILARVNELFPIPNEQEIDAKLAAFQEQYRYFLGLLHRKFKLREHFVENITTTVGRTVLARRLSGNTTYTGIVNYTALGTGTNPVAIGDTQLQTETYRKALSSGTYANNIAYLETFFTMTETSGTFQEYGNEIDGTGTVNTGQLFNHFLQAVTKSITETLNVQSTVTFADA